MLYRKYRPLSFNEVVGQEHVILTLQGALSNNRISHAYLFTGPRGTGKTTVARVFAKALNCLHRTRDGNPDNTCERCLAINDGRSLDLIEIDGASNGRVDEMRELKESAMVAAVSGGYKTFLIDEVHMVSTGGFNALLKILEEPPAHVIFIFATTDPHKIPLTILSRVQRFDFRKLTPDQIVQKLTEDAKGEKVKIEPEALMAIAHASDGAVRDAEVALTKVISFANTKETITAKDVQDILGFIPFNYHPQFLNLIAANDRAGAITFIQELYDGGINLDHFSKDFLEYLRTTLVSKVRSATLTSMQVNNPGDALGTISTDQIIKMLLVFNQARQNMKFSPIPQLPLELAVMELTK